MFRVLYKSSNANQSWASFGSYGNENSALNNASRISDRYFMVRVLDRAGNILWCA